MNFCKFLPQFGWTPIVLTVKKGVNTSRDDSLLESVKDIRVYRSGSFEPFLKSGLETSAAKEQFEKKRDDGPSEDVRRGFFSKMRRLVRQFLTVPDYTVFWIPFGVLKGLVAIRREKVSIIMSTSPPVSAHIIASVLSRLTRLPHLVDFRDLWTLNHVYNENNYAPIIAGYDKRWEKFVLKGADWLVTASPGFSEQMRAHCNGFLKDRVTTITNGFDYSGTEDLAEAGIEEDGIMRFAYFGSLYGRFNPVFFLECFAAWVSRSGDLAGKVRVDFYGNSDLDYSRFSGELGLENYVYFHGFKSRRDLLPVMTRADCLLLFLGFEESSAAVIPAKLFEYLAAGKPILALAPKGVTSDIIERYGAGYSLHEPDRDSLTGLFDRLRRERGGAGKGGGRLRYIEEIDRRNLTGRLAEILEKLKEDMRGERKVRSGHRAI